MQYLTRNSKRKVRIGDMNREVRILIIEDDRDLAKLFGDWQKLEWNLRVYYATTLAEGLQNLHTQDLDAVLLDLNLPDSQGIKTLSAIKQESDGIPVVIFSGMQDEALEKEAIRLGADGFLSKGTTSLEEALKAIQRAGVRQQERLKWQQDSEQWRSQALESQTRLRAMIERHQSDIGGWVKEWDESINRLLSLGERAKT